MNRRTFLTYSCATLVGATFVGCAPKAPYDLVPIKGVATYNGKPLPEGFTLQFENADGSRPSIAKIGPDGSFEAIHTASQKGVKPGSNAIVVYWNDPPEVNPVPEEFAGLVKKYGFTGTDKMTVDISKKDANFKVEFTD